MRVDLLDQSEDGTHVLVVEEDGAVGAGAQRDVAAVAHRQLQVAVHRANSRSGTRLEQVDN